MDVIEFERPTRAPVPRGSGFRAGAAKVDLTPPMGTWTAGWGPGLLPRRAIRFVSRLFGRVLVLDDGEGERVAFLTVDFHAGNRYLSERVAALTADLGLDVARVVLVGAHNHAGPGNLYATPYFDAFSTSYPWVRGFHQELADDVCARLAGAVREACAALEPARVGHGVAKVWGWTANRSLPAALENFQGETEAAVRARLSALHGAPAALTQLDRLFIDPRVQVLAATRPDGTPIGAFSTFAGHCALLAREHGALSGDWFGVAQQTAEALLATRHGRRPVFGLGAGAIGDVDPRPPDTTLEQLIVQRQRSLPENLLLVKTHGARLGAALVEAFDAATRGPAKERLTVRFAEPRIAGDTVPTKSGPAQLPHEPRIGASTLAGSELGPGFLSEGMRDDDPANARDPHWPKVDDDLGMRVIQPVLDVLQFLPQTVPLRVVSVGDVAVLGLPGEPTTWLAHRLSELVQELSAHREVVVAGTCGDYLGYFTSGREYELQHYEGASTLWGRYTERWLHKVVQALLEGPPTTSVGGAAKFLAEAFTGTRRRTLASLRAQEPQPPAPRERPRVQRLGTKLRFSGGFHWSPASAVPIFEWGDWLRLELAGRALDVEPHCLLDELSGALWWSVELSEWRDLVGRRVTVVLNHPEGAGRFELTVPG